MTPTVPTFSARFRCLGACGGEYPLTEVLVRCPTCDALLDVCHDETAWQARRAEDWRTLLHARAISADPLDQSGVWAQREWVLPHLLPSDIVSLGEGRTPLVTMPVLAKKLACAALHIKQCGHNPTGSFKDLGMTALVSAVSAIARQKPSAVSAIACASTGDTSAALAAYAARAGMKAIVFLPKGQLSDEQLTQPLAHFALTCALETDFDGCMALVAQFCQRHRVFLANSMNPLRIEGQKTLAVEIFLQLGGVVPDWVIVPSGNLGHLTALGKGFALLRTIGLTDRLPRLCAAQAAAAAPLYRAYRAGWNYQPVVAQPTLASAIRIGAPVHVHKAIALLQATQGVVEIASEAEILAACTQGDQHGLYTDPHTGVALAVLAKLSHSGTILPSERVVVISTAHGLKFGAQKRQHHQGLASPVSDAVPKNPPVSLPAELGAIERAILPRLLAS